MIIAVPDAPGLPMLQGVAREADYLVQKVPHAHLLRNPTWQTVIEALPHYAIAHFACHGSNDPADPSQSRLLLHDHDAAPLTVASLAPVNLDRAQLAYLSACNTTVTRSTELLDEAIHLTSAFQLAGFPHVIGTLWAISDQLAVAIAATFYTHLRTREDTLDTSHAAHALHHAIHVARDSYPATPSLWAAYLHAGT